jgi:hypothetical protein
MARDVEMLGCWGSTEEVLAYTYYFQSVSCSFLYQLQSFGSDIKVLDPF